MRLCQGPTLEEKSSHGCCCSTLAFFNLTLFSCLREYACASSRQRAFLFRQWRQSQRLDMLVGVNRIYVLSTGVYCQYSQQKREACWCTTELLSSLCWTNAAIKVVASVSLPTTNPYERFRTQEQPFFKTDVFSTNTTGTKDQCTLTELPFSGMTHKTKAHQRDQSPFVKASCPSFNLQPISMQLSSFPFHLNTFCVPVNTVLTELDYMQVHYQIQHSILMVCLFI